MSTERSSITSTCHRGEGSYLGVLLSRRGVFYDKSPFTTLPSLRSSYLAAWFSWLQLDWQPGVSTFLGPLGWVHCSFNMWLHSLYTVFLHFNFASVIMMEEVLSEESNFVFKEKRPPNGTVRIQGNSTL